MTDNESSKTDLWRPWETPVVAHSLPILLNCKICCHRFKRAEDLKRHRDSCHAIRLRKCSMCNEEFTRKDNLTRHMKNKHSEDLTLKPKCEFCCKRLSRQDAAARHQKTCHKNPKKMSKCSIIHRPNVIVSLKSLSKRKMG